MNISFYLLKCTLILPDLLLATITLQLASTNQTLNRSICYQEPKIWNELPADIKNIAQKNKHVFIKKFLHVNQKQPIKTFKLTYFSFVFSYLFFLLFFLYINCIQFDLQLIRLCFMHVVLLSCMLCFCRVYLLLECFRNSGWSLRHVCCSFLCFYNSVFIN